MDEEGLSNVSRASKETNTRDDNPLSFRFKKPNFQQPFPENEQFDQMQKPDPTGYPLRPNGDLVFFCSSISSNGNFRNHYSEWS
jgi:hypothetical protein